jgi:CubicO group peptidase (beta-lactamase class C family)
MLMQRLVEKLSGKKLDEYLKAEFYQPLGLQHITYQPLQQFTLEQIVPTERDKRWRQRLVHGFVHDETAALFGGVGGHAGLFSNSDNLAIISQLLLDKGSYGGREFIKQKTVDQFTKAQYGTHRGLGFDTAGPRSRSAFSRVVPTETFGHTGFTGTCLWVDPENDIVYVFLSNRLHPSAKNRRFLRRKIRERIQEVVYDALSSEDDLWPDLALLGSNK